MKKGKLVNCNIISRKDDDFLFIQRLDGTIVANLDGYTIVPNEVYNTLTEKLNG